MDFYYWLGRVLNILLCGYIYIIPLLMLIALFAKAYRQIFVKWISILNGWFCVYAIGTALLLFMDWYNQNKYEGYSFDYKNSLVAGNSLHQVFMLYFFSKLLLIIFAVLFIFKNCRQNIWLTSFCYISLFFVPIFLFFSAPTLESKPGAWVSFQTSKPWWENNFIYLLIYLLLIFSTSFIQKLFSILQMRVSKRK